MTNGSGTRRVGIVGTFDVQNYGDLLFPIIAGEELCRRLGDVEIVPLSYRTLTTAQWPYAVTSVADLPELISDLDGLLIGGGFVIRFDKDVAPGYRPPAGVHHPTGYWLTPALLALQHDVPVAWNAPGMHCNDIPAWAEDALQLALGHSRYIGVRDEPTRRALARFAPDRVTRVPDTGFGLAHMVDAPPSAAFRALSDELGLEQPYIVVQAAIGSRPFAQFVRDHAEVFAGQRFLALPVGTVLGDSADHLSDLIDVITVPTWPDPLLLAEIVQHADAVVGHSYHLTITAMVAGVPVHTPGEFTDGKYTALAELGGVQPLRMDNADDAQQFIQGLGRGARPAGIDSVLEQLQQHWDHVAAAIDGERPNTAPVIAAYLQRLPTALETNADRADALAVALDAQRADADEELVRQQGLANRAIAHQARTLDDQARALDHQTATIDWLRTDALALHAHIGTLEGLLHTANTGLMEREAQLAATQAELAALQQRASQLAAVLHQTRHRVADGYDVADSLKASTSWKATGPLRAVTGLARGGRTERPIIRMPRLFRGELQTDPFEWALVDGLFDPADAAALVATFPRDHFATIESYGGEKDYSYEARSLVPMGADAAFCPETLSPAWRRLAADFVSPAYRAALSALTGTDLTDHPLEVNISHYGPHGHLGAHTDLPEKVVTSVMYFNDGWDPADGGCLELLRSSDPADIVTIVPPQVGNCVVFTRSHRSWHAVGAVQPSAPRSRRSLTAVFHKPGSTSSMWPADNMPEMHDYTGPA